MAGGNRAVQRLCSIIARQVRTYSAPADRSIPPNKQKYVPTEGTYPKGFRVGAAHAGVKKSNTRFDDIALVVSDSSCHAAAVMTRNVFQAAPVVLSRKILRRTDQCRSIVVNSGCANAVTGQQGMEDAEAMSKETDRLLFGDNLPQNASQTLVMSTGVIGQKLPMDRILPAIPKAYEALGSTHDHWLRAAQAICTTDTFPKLISREFTLPSHPETKYSIAGMTKGAGMIHPNMGTLLGIICTDVKIASEAPGTMRQLLSRANQTSFNSISIDGDTSTNDTVALFANGAAAPQDVPGIHWKKVEDDDDSIAFRHVLQQFMTELAQLVVRDGEGATKFVTIRVRSDRSMRTAYRVAESIARSSLVKTALYGKDANWGRILCAIGYAPGIMRTYTVREASNNRNDPHVVPKRTSVSFIPADGSEELKLLTRGEPENVDEERAKQILEMEDLEILVRLEDDGPDVPETSEAKKIREALYWTCDLSHEYVTINGDYRT